MTKFKAFLRDKDSNMKPKLVGIWVMASLAEQGIVQWGQDGGTELPFGPDQKKEATDQALHVMGTAGTSWPAVYLLNVFDNGQIRLDEVETPFFEMAAS